MFAGTLCFQRFWTAMSIVCPIISVRLQGERGGCVWCSAGLPWHMDKA